MAPARPIVVAQGSPAPVAEAPADLAWLVAEVRRRRAVEAARRAEGTPADAPADAPASPGPEYIGLARSRAERRMLYGHVTRYVRAFFATSARLRVRHPTPAAGT